MNELTLLLALFVGWVSIGLALGWAMARRGHLGFGWLVLGALTGPLAVVLAWYASRAMEGLEAGSVAPGAPAQSGVNALVGFDGTPRSSAALTSTVELLGDRLGRLTVATVVPHGCPKADEKRAAAVLAGAAERWAWLGPELEVLHGRPGRALVERARAGGYDVIAIGSRRHRLHPLGSTADELSRQSAVPVIVAGAVG